MKIIITSILCLSLICLPCHRPKAQAVPAVVLLCVTGLAVGGIYYIHLKSCEPRYYCIKMDNDQPNSYRWCQAMGRPPQNEAATNGWKIVSGPYKLATDCDRNCINHPNVFQNLADEELLNDQLIIIVQQSSTLNGPWYDIYTETNSLMINLDFEVPNTVATVFYRLKIVSTTPTMAVFDF